MFLQCLYMDLGMNRTRAHNLILNNIVCCKTYKTNWSKIPFIKKLENFSFCNKYCAFESSFNCLLSHIRRTVISYANGSRRALSRKLDLLKINIQLCLFQRASKVHTTLWNCWKAVPWKLLSTSPFPASCFVQFKTLILWTTEVFIRYSEVTIILLCVSGIWISLTWPCLFGFTDFR